jgi:hypothetical protein
MQPWMSLVLITAIEGKTAGLLVLTLAEICGRTLGHGSGTEKNDSAGNALCNAT